MCSYLEHLPRDFQFLLSDGIVLASYLEELTAACRFLPKLLIRLEHQPRTVSIPDVPLKQYDFQGGFLVLISKLSYRVAGTVHKFPNAITLWRKCENWEKKPKTWKYVKNAKNAQKLQENAHKKVKNAKNAQNAQKCSKMLKNAQKMRRKCEKM